MDWKDIKVYCGSKEIKAITMVEYKGDNKVVTEGLSPLDKRLKIKIRYNVRLTENSFIQFKTSKVADAYCDYLNERS